MAIIVAMGCIFLLALVYCKRPRRRPEVGVVRMSTLQPPTSAQIQQTANTSNHPVPYSALYPFTNEKKLLDPDSEFTFPPPAYDLCVIENHDAIEKL